MMVLSTNKKFTNKTFARALFAVAACTALRFLFPSYDDYYDDDDSRDAFSRRQLAQQQANDVQTGNSSGGNAMPHEEVVVVQDHNNQAMMDRLKETQDLWLRGGYLYDHHSGQIGRSNAWGREDELKAAAQAHAALDEKFQIEQRERKYEPFTICDRHANVGSAEDEKQTCPEITQDIPLMLIEGSSCHGRTGNNLIEFLHAIQQARDNHVQLGIMRDSWAISLLTKMWMADYIADGDDDGFVSLFENAFCVKIFHSTSELEGWDYAPLDTKLLLHYGGLVKASLPEYMADQERYIRTLFRHINTGTKRDKGGRPVNDMCSGIKALFGSEEEDQVSNSEQPYSVIHSRSLAREGDSGIRMLQPVSLRSGCDREGALEMKPDYVKSILAPLGMMKYPIVFITDGQNKEILDRLLADPDLGPMIRLAPSQETWIGGDLTLAVMSNVFIGNPASTFTGFIAKARVALGFGHNYLFRARDENGKWRTTCGDHCVYDKTIMRHHA